MNLPKNLLNAIMDGNSVLILGTGASAGAKDDKGNEMPDSIMLKNLLIKRFLDDSYKEEDLAYISTIAKDTSDFYTFQDYIAEIFYQFKPANFHEILPTFKWRAIFTTNFDQVIEKAYDNCKNKIQNLKSIISNEDRIDRIVRSTEDLPYFKLHGCISKTHDEKTPIILTLDQYINFSKGRDRLFAHFHDMGYENTFIIVGHSLRDPDIRFIMNHFIDLGEGRPEYFLITPEARDEEIRFWDHRRISVLKGSFKDFLISLDNQISQQKRNLLKLVKIKNPIEKRFISNIEMSNNCYDFLNNDADYISDQLEIDSGTPQAFYRGWNFDWYPIAENLDVERDLLQVIFWEKIITADDNETSNTGLYLISAEAGSGKSIFLKRLAWYSSKEANLLCIFLKRYGQINYDALREIYNLTNQRILLFVDNAADNAVEIENLLTKAQKDNLKITVFTAERINEWNMACGRLDKMINEKFILPYLNEKEVENLLRLLEKNNCLGYLKKLSRIERIDQFKNRSGSQLLVALHETTLGKPFEEILVDEYNEIRPELAKLIYLTVCVLNRLKVEVRAGLISRLYNISFENFKEKLFRPLEHIVEATIRKNSYDYYYVARHPHIAEIVFERILTDENDRFEEYKKILSSLNISYNSDRKSFRYLIRGKDLINLFSSINLVEEIYEIAKNISIEDPYVYQQLGIFKMILGNLDESKKYLLDARELDKNDLSIVHSLAELYRKKAENSEIYYEKEKFRHEARKYISLLMNCDANNNNRNFGISTLLKLCIDELKDLLKIEDYSKDLVNKIIDEIESTIEKGLEEFPGDSYILSLEYEFQKTIKDEKGAFQTLIEAYCNNKHLPFIAIRLSKSYKFDNKIELAISTIKEALSFSKYDKSLHFQYAQLLIEQGNYELEEVIYHLQRSFLKGDENYFAQFLFARYCFESNDNVKIDNGINIFRDLRNSQIPYDQRNKIYDTIKDNNQNKKFRGTIISKQETHGVINRFGNNDNIFMHQNNVDDDVWKLLKNNQFVQFEIGFDYSGPIAINVIPEN